MTQALISFEPPEEFTHEKFIARKLCARDAYLDYMAVMSSIALIRKTRGGNWPTQQLTFEDDLIDLSWHQREFENRSSFAYTVMTPDERQCLGCFYLYPPGFRGEAPEGSDADVSFWVTQEAYDTGLYVDLYKALKQWVPEYFQFKKIHWSNKEIPQEPKI